jgi:hypothetical membrane protein
LDEYRKLIGPILWVSSIQYFIVQVIVARAWVTPFSLSYNPISDLGNTSCSQFYGRIVCSPLHPLMNISFIALGLTTLIGSILIYRIVGLSKLGFTLMGLAGLGTIFVGLFPENTIKLLHVAGATLPFLLGNISMIVLSRALLLPKSLRLYTLISGVIGLLSLSLLVTHYDLGLGSGGIERITAYPQTIWLIVFGVYVIVVRKTSVRGQKTT